MTHDVIIIGGSYAGLAAGLQLARARRRVLVIDAGMRRNRFAGNSHGFLTQDGTAAAEIAAKGRSQLLAYDTVEWLLKNIPNHNGKVGMIGISQPGFHVAASMMNAHAALKAGRWERGRNSRRGTARMARINASTGGAGWPGAGTGKQHSPESRARRAALTALRPRNRGS